MSILKLAQKQPVAFIVYAPPRELLAYDPLRVERTIRGLESGIEGGMVALTERPTQIFLENKVLSRGDRRARDENLQALNQGLFKLLILAGAGISQYLREIIWHACMSDTDISLYADEDSLLTRYLHMQQAGRI